MRRFVLASALVAVLVGGLAACGKKDDPAAGGGTGTNQGLGSAPTQSPAGGGAPGGGAPGGPGGGATPSTTGGPGGGGGGNPTPPPVLANKSGYVWGSKPATASYAVTGNYWYNSSGGGITITRTGTGSYTVRFEGLGDSGGIAHAQAYGNTPNFCTVVNWLKNGANQDVRVKCFAPNTTEADTMFLASFAVGSQGGANFSYLWADKAGTSGKYTPQDKYRYDTTGNASTVERIAAGKYRVFIPASADTPDPETFQVTAYGPVTIHCKIGAIRVAAGTHEVHCRDATGAFFDARFALSYATAGSLIGRGDRRFGDFSRSSDGVTSGAVGVFTVPALELGQNRGQVVATAVGPTNAYCHTGGWGAAGTTLNMTVRCYGPGGVATNSDFSLGVTW
jgi:hypothetical protein